MNVPFAIMPAASFVIPGAPYAKKRHRSFFNKKMGRAQAVNPAENKSFEAKVAEIALTHMPGPIDGPVRIIVEAIFDPAASWSKRRRAAALGGYHTQKPDGDNILKAVKDGLNRVAWADDCQVAEATIIKRWGERAETRITLYSVRASQ